MKLGAIVLEGQRAPDKAVIYIIKNGGEILYIGKSNQWEWDIDFVEIPNDILDSGSQARVNYWIKDKEAMLIREFCPKYNILNRFK